MYRAITHPVRNGRVFYFIVAEGFEPSTPRLYGARSTIELRDNSVVFRVLNILHLIAKQLKFYAFDGADGIGEAQIELGTETTDHVAQLILKRRLLFVMTHASSVSNSATASRRTQSLISRLNTGPLAFTVCRRSRAMYSIAKG